MKFYRIKEICMDFHISPTTLYAHIKAGKLPELEKPFPLNTKIVGYNEETFKSILAKLVQTLQTPQTAQSSEHETA